MLGIMGLVFIFVAPIFIYRSAGQNGHNPVFWALAALGVGIVLQLILPLLLSIAVGVFLVAQGQSPAEIQQSMQTPGLVIGLAGMVLSVGGVLLIMRRVNTVRDTDKPYTAPPAPPNFN